MCEQASCWVVDHVGQGHGGAEHGQRDAKQAGARRDLQHSLPAHVVQFVLNV